MRLEKYIVPTIFLDLDLPDAIRMISHETMKNALHPKNHHGFEYAQRTTDCHRLASHSSDPAPTSTVTDRIFCASWERRSTGEPTVAGSRTTKIQ